MVSLLKRLARAARRRVRRYNRVLRFNVWYGRLDGSLPEIEERMDVQFRPAGPRDLPLFKGVVSDEKIVEFERRLAAGHICILGLKEGRIVFYVWFAVGTQYPSQLNRALDPGKGFAYLFDMLTVPEHRGKGIASAGLLSACVKARDAGCSYAIGWIRLRNVPSSHMFQRLGFTPKWRSIQVRILGHDWLRARPIVSRGSFPGLEGPAGL